jgi:hypothetical protein
MKIIQDYMNVIILDVNIKERKDMKLKKLNNKAQNSFNIFSFMIVSVLAVIFFAGLIYSFGIINSTMHQVGVMNDQNHQSNFTFPCPDNSSNTCQGSTYVNMTQASDEIFGQLNTSIQSLRMVAIVYILGLAVCIIITNSLIKVNPIWFFAYVLICLLAVIFAPTISNAYYSLLLDSNFMNGTLQTFSASNYIILNLPIVVLVVSVAGGIFLFLNNLRSENQGGLG